MATSTASHASVSPTASSNVAECPAQTIPLKVVFMGGLAPTFGPHPVDTHAIQLPYSTGMPPTAGALVKHLTETLLCNASKTQLETFVLSRGDCTPRPGILVLVNDADWELDGGPDWLLSAGDEVLFVSTLHGG